MIGKNINSIKHVTIAKAKEILKQRSKDGDLLYEQAGSLAYCERFAKLPEKTAQKIVDELVEMGISEESAIKVADIVPDHKTQLGAILAKETPEVPQSKQDSIFEILAPYQKQVQEHAEKMAEHKHQQEIAAAKEAEEKAATEAVKEEAEKPEKVKKEMEKHERVKEDAPIAETKPKKERKTKKHGKS